MVPRTHAPQVLTSKLQEIESKYGLGDRAKVGVGRTGWATTRGGGGGGRGGHYKQSVRGTRRWGCVRSGRSPEHRFGLRLVKTSFELRGGGRAGAGRGHVARAMSKSGWEARAPLCALLHALYYVKLRLGCAVLRSVNPAAPPPPPGSGTAAELQAALWWPAARTPHSQTASAVQKHIKSLPANPVQCC